MRAFSIVAFFPQTRAWFSIEKACADFSKIQKKKNKIFVKINNNNKNNNNNNYNNSNNNNNNNIVHLWLMSTPLFQSYFYLILNFLKVSKFENFLGTTKIVAKVNSYHSWRYINLKLNKRLEP